MDEIRGFFAVHQDLGTHPGGIHVELTGDDVTEVLGGSEEIAEGYARRALRDPQNWRLNHQQLFEMAFLVAEELPLLSPIRMIRSASIPISLFQISNASSSV